MPAEFTTLDWVVIAVYFLALFGIAAWVIRQRNESSTDYFLAGRHVGWFVVGASIFASNVGSEHVVFLAESGARNGTVEGHWELHAYLCLVLGWLFVPFYMRSRVFTMPEFLERRFGPSCRWLLSITTLVAYVLTKISLTIYAGGIVLTTLVGIDFWVGAVVIVALTGVYTVLGGLRAVVYTEALQAIVLILGSLIVLFIALSRAGGWSAVEEAVEPGLMNMFRPLADEHFPWLGMLLACPIVGLWYWCTDQYIVQRVLAARDEKSARRGTIFAAYLKMFPFFIFLLPGVVALALEQQGQLVIEDKAKTFPTMVATFLPAGVRGIVAGGLLAALMSSLAAVFNSSSTLFTIDIYKKLRPEAPERRLVLVGRIATAALVMLGLLWIPVLQDLNKGIYTYLQSVQSSIAPPIAAVFFLGVFFKRLNERGAMTALIVGFVIGMSYLSLGMVEGLSGVLADFVAINFLYFSFGLFVFCSLLMVAVSLLTARPSEAQIDGLTYATTVPADRAASRASWNRTDVILSLGVLAMILAIFAYFSPLRFG